MTKISTPTSSDGHSTLESFVNASRRSAIRSHCPGLLLSSELYILQDGREVIQLDRFIHRMLDWPQTHSTVRVHPESLARPHSWRSPGRLSSPSLVIMAELVPGISPLASRLFVTMNSRLILTSLHFPRDPRAAPGDGWSTWTVPSAFCKNPWTDKAEWPLETDNRAKKNVSMQG